MSIQNYSISLMRIIICLLIFSPSFGYGQKTVPETLSSAGDHHVFDNINLDWTLGEIAVESIMAGNMQLTQGFQQGSLMTTAIPYQIDDDFVFNIYPNPTNRHLILETNFPGEWTAALYDIKGQQIMTQYVSSLSTTMDLVTLSDGIYFLKINSSDGLSNWFFIKKIR